MSTARKALVAGVTVVLIMTFASTASARNFSIFSNNSEELVSRGNVTFSYRNERGETVTLIECPMTLSATFETGTFESEGGRVGSFRFQNVRCAAGTTFTPLNTPAITGNMLQGGPGNEAITGYLVTGANAQFLIDANLGTYRCLYRGTLNWLIRWIWNPVPRNWTEETWTALPFNALAANTTNLPGGGFCVVGTLTINGTFVPQSPRTWYP